MCIFWSVVTTKLSVFDYTSFVKKKNYALRFLPKKKVRHVFLKLPTYVLRNLEWESELWCRHVNTHYSIFFSVFFVVENNKSYCLKPIYGNDTCGVWHVYSCLPIWKVRSTFPGEAMTTARLSGRAILKTASQLLDCSGPPPPMQISSPLLWSGL